MSDESKQGSKSAIREGHSPREKGWDLSNEKGLLGGRSEAHARR